MNGGESLAFDGNPLALTNDLQGFLPPDLRFVRRLQPFCNPNACD